MSLNYTPPPTVARFMVDDTHLIRVIVGPVGSGKSMGCIMELLRRARLQVPYEKVRRTKFALIRNTMQQLRQTVLSDVQTYLGPVVHYFVTDSTIQVRGQLPDGTTMESDWLLMPLDTKQDTQKLLSMQLTGAWVNELREVPVDVIEALSERVGRYPSNAMGGRTWRGIIADTNPWDTDSPYHERMVLNPNPLYALYHQPSGLGPYAENLENLEEGYYERLAQNPDTERVSVQVESNWGTSNAGTAVFSKSFDALTHVKDMQAVVNPNRPLVVGLDFGRTPCAVIGQTDSYGRALIMKEVVTEGMGLVQMLEEHLKPALNANPFAGRRIVVIGDPAGIHRGQITEETPFDVLKYHGFLAYPASTNNIDPRLLAVERMLRAQIAGQPGLQISREGCPTLIRAMGNRYRYRKKRDGVLEDTPEKLHPWSDVCDALQYWCLGTQANLVGRAMRRFSASDQSSVRQMPAGAWT